MNFQQFCRSMGLDPSTLTKTQRKQLEKLFSQCDHRNAQIDKDLYTRVFKASPHTFNEESRTVDAIILSDAPVMMYDWEHGWVKEILPMDTVRLPASIPLINAHQSFDCRSVYGSCRSLRIEKQESLSVMVSTLSFARDQESYDTMNKVRDGHITDLSGGYRIYESRLLEAGESLQLHGKIYHGPVKIALDWEPYEGSLCPIGADRFAKIRAARTPSVADQQSEPASTETPETKVTSSAKRTVSPERGTNSQEVTAMTFKQFCRSIGVDETALTEAQRVALEAVFEARCKDLSESADVDAETRAKAKKIMDASAEAVRKATEEATRAEAQRHTEIRSLCTSTGHAAIADELVKSCTTIQEAERKIIERVKASHNPVGVSKTDIVGGVDERDKFRSAVQGGLLLRYGNGFAKEPAPGSSDFQGRSALRIAEECLVKAGINTRGMSDSEIATRAMSSSDFPIILANTANIMLAKEHELAEETWSEIVEITDGKNFKDMTVANFGGVPTFSEVLENGKYKEVTFNEIGESYRIKTYGSQATASRQTIINDGLDAFFRAAGLFVQGSNKLIGNGVWGLITSNPAVKTLNGKDSNTLFHANHGNLIANANALGTEGMKAMRKSFRTMKETGGEAMGLTLGILAVPAELEEQGRILAENKEMMIDGVVVKNTSYGTKLLVEHRLDAVSEVDYYGFPTKGKPIQVAFLNGRRVPEAVRLNNVNPDELTILYRMDAGWGVADHRYAVKADV